MTGERTRSAVFSQPEWLRQVAVERTLPEGARVVHTGCGTSFHAAQTGGRSVQALEAVLDPPDADVLVCVSHEGGTRLTIEAAEAFGGEVWAITAADGPLSAAADVVVKTPGPVEDSWCHTRSYTCAVATIAALHGEDVSWLAGAVEEALARPPFPVSEHERWLVAGAGRDWPTAQEAALKLREGTWVAAEAHQTEQLLHGHLAAVDESVRAFVLEGEGRAAERAADAVRALEALGCDATLVPTRHPVVDIVPFHLLVIDLAAARGVNPDAIRRDQRRWRAAAAAHGSDEEPPQ